MTKLKTDHKFHTYRLIYYKRDNFKKKSKLYFYCQRQQKKQRWNLTSHIHKPNKMKERRWKKRLKKLCRKKCLLDIGYQEQHISSCFLNSYLIISKTMKADNNWNNINSIMTLCSWIWFKGRSPNSIWSQHRSHIHLYKYLYLYLHTQRNFTKLVLCIYFFYLQRRKSNNKKIIYSPHRTTIREKEEQMKTKRKGKFVPFLGQRTRGYSSNIQTQTSNS